MFTDLTRHLFSLVEQHIGVPRWHDLRVVAADASDVRFTLRDATHHVIKCAKVFALYLPGIEMMLHATLYGTDTGERQMLFEHLELLGADDLLVLDRGYPASWLMAALPMRAIKLAREAGDVYAVLPSRKHISSAVSAFVSYASGETCP